MEKSIILSKAAFLAIFLVVIASCVPFSSASRAATQVGLESEPAPVDVIEFCHTNADCNNKCSPAGRHALCVYGVCSCKVGAKDSLVVMKDETCSAIEECKSTKCLPKPGWHVECVDGKCKCVFDVPPRVEVTDETCTTGKDCKSTKCIELFGWHLRCVNGTCKCVHDGRPPKAELTASPPETYVEPKVDQGCPPSDCYEISCVEGCPERIHGRCQCVRPVSF